MATLAALADGLPPEARVKRKYTGVTASEEMLVLALILDVVNIIAWRQTEDGYRGKNAPKSVYTMLAGGERKEPQRDYRTFRSGEDFEAARKEILRRGGYTEQ